MSAEWKAVSQKLTFLQWRPTHEPGTVLVRDLRDPESELLLHGKERFLFWVAQHSKNSTYLPVGDWISFASKKFGIDECTPCAKRRAVLNTLFPKLKL